MTDNVLQRLYWRTGTDQSRPLENFTTEALAIAIAADPRPMLEALRHVEWFGREPVDPEGFDSARPDTQVGLWADATTRVGQLDLVMTLAGAARQPLTVWGEAKVFAPVSGKQLAVYDDERKRPDRRATLITISSTPLSYIRDGALVRVPWLGWRRIWDAVRSTPDADRWWRELVVFLADVGLVPSDRSSGVHVERDKVLMEVNNILKRLWPESGSALFWRQVKTMVEAAEKEATAGRPFQTTGGVLLYGLDADSWFLWVRTRNAQSVKVDPDAIVHLADARGLPGSWRRDRMGQPYILAATMPNRDDLTLVDIVGWYDERLTELLVAGVLDGFLAATRGNLP